MYEQNENIKQIVSNMWTEFLNRYTHETPQIYKNRHFHSHETKRHFRRRKGGFNLSGVNFLPNITSFVVWHIEARSTLFNHTTLIVMLIDLNGSFKGLTGININTLS